MKRIIIVFSLFISFLILLPVVSAQGMMGRYTDDSQINFAVGTQEYGTLLPRVTRMGNYQNGGFPMMRAFDNQRNFFGNSMLNRVRSAGLHIVVGISLLLVWITLILLNVALIHYIRTPRQ